MLNENTVPRPTNQQVNASQNVTQARRIRVRSTRYATIGSSSEMAELQAATATSTKNTTPINCPNATLPNANGSATNIRPGPSLGLSPAAKTIGNSAKPASSETKVSSSAMPTTVVLMEAPLVMYAP
ncbi:hypothetical protein ALP75_200979 [Pseudomonas syringae pv. actinidiae]|nr:hypothetical protein ALP75_200979 [Pseudomonas syringae pv. actinidiae]